ncbi:DUF4184 family protein [Mucilaginibacter mali]|uniref:DUF4184 family protein n=1 Tax=Mucilaginibacter mali TaxID=2740462 RepID=A0A7D4Q8J7_9SPHI|nr:DUF4184 family protein [Mucilaginibacter mali]QKJ30771.1 DUF4184 family protein [Mucilaginibacter mali]
MPFTFAHPAIVLPFGRLSKRWVSLTGLVIGSMVPDFEYFIRMRVCSNYSHTLPGLFWFDLPLGLLLVFIYQILIKDKLICNLPSWLNQRFSSFMWRPFYTANHFLILIISILTGAASHLLWDGFTHPAGYFVQRIDWLRTTPPVFGFRIHVFKVLQHLSTITGFIVIFCTIWFLPKEPGRTSPGIFKYWSIVTLTAIAVLLIRFFIGLSITAYGDWIVTSISGFLLGILTASLFIKHSPHQTVPHP